MTRTAPLMTLLAVGVLGGALFVANTVGTDESTAAAENTAASAPADPAAAPPPAAPAPPAEAQPGEQVDLADVPVAGEDGADGADDPDAAEPPAAGDATGDATGENAPLDDNVYAGRTDDREFTVAIAINDGEAAAYVCAGPDLEIWLSGTATEAGLDLSSNSGRSTLTGTLDGGTITGTFTTDGDESDYTAEETTVAEARADGRPDVGRVAERAGL